MRTEDGVAARWITAGELWRAQRSLRGPTSQEVGFFVTMLMLVVVRVSLSGFDAGVFVFVLAVALVVMPVLERRHHTKTLAERKVAGLPVVVRFDGADVIAVIGVGPEVDREADTQGIPQPDGLPVVLIGKRSRRVRAVELHPDGRLPAWSPLIRLEEA